MAFFVNIEVPAALEGTLHPFFRTALESMRFGAGFVLLLGCLKYAVTFEDLKVILKALILGGIMSSIYAVYEGLVLYVGLPGPLGPGSRSLPGFPVAGSMYEASAAGTYAAVTMLLSLGVFLERKFFLSGIGIISSMLGILITTSRTGVVAALVGSFIFIGLLIKIQKIRQVSITMFTSIIIYLIGSIVAIGVIGELFYNRLYLAEYQLQYHLSIREQVYKNALLDFMRYPAGLGQGLWLYLEGGGVGWARLAVEGGIIGLFLITNAIVALGYCISRLVSQDLTALEASIISAVCSTFVALFNYVNITDSWILVVLGLPFVALKVHDLQNTDQQPGKGIIRTSRSEL